MMENHKVEPESETDTGIMSTLVLTCKPFCTVT